MGMSCPCLGITHQFSRIDQSPYLDLDTGFLAYLPRKSRTERFAEFETSPGDAPFVLAGWICAPNEQDLSTAVPHHGAHADNDALAGRIGAHRTLLEALGSLNSNAQTLLLAASPTGETRRTRTGASQRENPHMPRLGVAVIAMLACLLPSVALTADNSLSVQANEAFLAANAKKPGVVTQPSGLQYRIVHSGFGKRPGPLDSVDVNYTGTLINGTVFDKTEQGMPAHLKVNGVIPGWTEALEIMREGDEWELVIPAPLAYGTRGAGGVIPPNQTLLFDLELVKVTPPPPKDEKEDQDQSSQ